MSELGIYFEINGYRIKGIRKDDYKEGTRYIRTSDSKRSKDGTGHMKLLTPKHVLTLNLKNVPSEICSEIDNAINTEVDKAIIKYFSFKKGAITGEDETYYFSDYDFSYAGTRNNNNYANINIEMIQN